MLVVLQGMDTSGKDGTIKHVFQHREPARRQGRRTSSGRTTPSSLTTTSGASTTHARGDGHITIFNRCHYEDVLVVRVHDLVPKKQWSRRYRHICDFERMLADEGTVIRKFFLHISKDEQKRAARGAA